MTLSFWLLKVTLILSLALVLDIFLRRWAVLACAAMWNAVLLGLALFPAAVLFVPATKLPLLRAETPSVFTASTRIDASIEVATADQTRPTQVADSPEAAIAPHMDAEFAATESRVDPKPVNAGWRLCSGGQWSS